jgi:glyoxylase-like metal-dependent hydrolase (beta-lactamase superfamily II)
VSPTVRIHALALGAIGTNCYVVGNVDTGQAIVVDPGDEAHRVDEVLAKNELTLEGILVTHAHWDHIGAIAPLATTHDVAVWMSERESVIVEERINDFVPAGVGPFETHPVEHKLHGGETISLAGMELEAIHLPGHSPGTIGFYLEGVPGEAGEWEQPPILFCGDLIFEGSVGRTDLPFADHQQLLDSIALLLDRLHDETLLLSGHGRPTTLGAERATNPFLAPIVGGRLG